MQQERSEVGPEAGLKRGKKERKVGEKPWKEKPGLLQEHGGNHGIQESAENLIYLAG